MLQWLDELEDLLYCLPMLWTRIRGWLLLVLSFTLGALVLISTPVLTVAPALLALMLLVGVLLVGVLLAQALRLGLLRRPAGFGLADRT